MEELEKACSEAEEALQKALNSLRESCEYSAVLSEANFKTEGKRSRLMELNVVCEMEKQMKAMDELHRRKTTDLSAGWDTESRETVFHKASYQRSTCSKRCCVHCCSQCKCQCFVEL